MEFNAGKSDKISEKKTLKELCMEDKAKVGQLVQKLALEKATRKKSEGVLEKETSQLNALLNALKEEQASLLKESEYFQESLVTSLSQIDSMQNSQVMHSIESHANHKTSYSDVSICTQHKDSVNISIQTVSENFKTEIPEKESTVKKYFQEDVKRVIEKAQVTSARLEKFFSSTNTSFDESFRTDKFEKEKPSRVDFIGLMNKEEKKQVKCENDEDEIVVIEEPFYDAHLLDVIEQMEDFDEMY